jgi:electron transfer flavoprotein beta subunit
MQNMRLILPALQKAKPAQVTAGCAFTSVALPKQTRETRIVKDTPVEDIAREIAEWVTAE